jgi:hypothetical protein
MQLSELRRLRQMARELTLPPGAVQIALECGVFSAGQAPPEQARLLRQMRRMMADLGVSAPAAALLVRMRRELEAMQAELERLRQLEAGFFHAQAWREGWWHELDE